MSTTQQQRGIVFEGPDVTILDTRTLEWEPIHEWRDLPALKTALRKVLSPGGDGLPAVAMNYYPAGFTLPDLPYRHFHSTVHEYTYKLWGELPHWEYENAEQQHGTMTRGRAHSFMHRLPGSIHGLEPGPVNETGTLGVSWQSGKGVLIGDPGFEVETVHVDFAPGWQPNPDPREPQTSTDGRGVIIEWGDLVKLDTLAMAWETVPGLEGARRKVLARDEQGAASVEISWLPAGFTLPELPYRHYHSTVHEYSYVLGGELPHWEYESPDQQEGDLVVFREGYFMHRRPGSLHGLEAGVTSPTGVLLLSWRTGPGTTIGEEGFDEETVHVPYR